MVFTNRMAIRVLASALQLFFVIPLRIIFNKPLSGLSPSIIKEILDGILQGPIAHRGGIPENTLTGFHLSKALGASTIEVDLQFTKDGHPVLLHDWTVDRTSNGSGYLKDFTLNEVKKLDVGRKYGHIGTTIPTLYETVEALKQLDMFMFLELKSGSPLTVPTVLKLFKEDPSLYNRIIVITFFPDIIYKLRQHDMNIVTGLVVRGTLLSRSSDSQVSYKQRWKVRLAELLERAMFWYLTGYIWKILGVGVLLPHKDDILSKRFDLEFYRKKGIAVVTWTVNSGDEKDHFHHVLKLPYMTDYLGELDQQSFQNASP